MNLPGYDNWKTTTPADRPSDTCSACGDRLLDEDAIRVDAGEYVCSAECEGRWGVENLRLPADQLSAALEVDDPDFQITVVLATGISVTGWVHGRRRGEYLLADFDDYTWDIDPERVKSVKVA